MTSKARAVPRSTDVVIAKVTKNQPCRLNGPWTGDHRQNVHRVLAAIGVLRPTLDVHPAHEIQPIAEDGLGGVPSGIGEIEVASARILALRGSFNRSTL